MYLYGYYDNDNKEKVSLGAVKYLSEQLERFLKIYEKDVFIEDAEDRKCLEQLKLISQALKDQRYYELITDPQYVIDFNDDDDDYLPDYFPL